MRNGVARKGADYSSVWRAAPVAERRRTDSNRHTPALTETFRLCTSPGSGGAWR
jgi:hypothetical protein